MARVTRFRPTTTIHPFNLDQRTGLRENCRDSLSVIMALGVVALLLGGLAMNAPVADVDPAAPIVEARAG